MVVTKGCKVCRPEVAGHRILTDNHVSEEPANSSRVTIGTVSQRVLPIILMPMPGMLFVTRNRVPSLIVGEARRHAGEALWRHRGLLRPSHSLRRRRIIEHDHQSRIPTHPRHAHETMLLLKLKWATTRPISDEGRYGVLVQKQMVQTQPVIHVDGPFVTGDEDGSESKEHAGRETRHVAVAL